MKNDIVEPSDPRLTAYAVGELPPDELAAFEIALENSPAAREELEQIRETAELLRQEFGAELETAFTPREPAASSSLRVVEREEIHSLHQLPGFLPEMRTAIGALAAVLVAIAVVAVTWMKHGNNQAEDRIVVAESAAGIRDEKSEANEAAVSTAPVAGIALTTEVATTETPNADDSWSVVASVGTPTMPSISLASAETDGLAAGSLRLLGDDPIEARGRFLGDDPIQLHPIPLPSAIGGPPGALPFGYTLKGLDPDVANPERYLELSGQIRGEHDGGVTRSIFLVDKSTDENGNPAVRLKGQVHVEDHGSMMVATVTGPDGEEVVGLARKAATNPETGEVQLTGGPPTLQMGNRMIRPSSEDAKIFLMPDGTHRVSGRSAVNFQIAGADSPEKSNVGRSLDDLVGDSVTVPGEKVAAPTASPVTASGGNGGTIVTGSGIVDSNAPFAQPGSSSRRRVLLPHSSSDPAQSVGGSNAGMIEFGKAPSKIENVDDFAAADSISTENGGIQSDAFHLESFGETKADENSGKPVTRFRIGGAPVKLDYGTPIDANQVKVNGGKFNLTLGDDFEGGENDALGLADPLDAGLLMSHATAGVVSPEAGAALRWAEEAAPAPSKPVAGRGKFARTVDNPFVDPMTVALSTFSVDVDTASYTEVRRMILKDGQLPDRDQVRIEEFINYFNYDSYEAPELAEVEANEQTPFSVRLECAAAPWNPDNRIVRIGLKGADIPGGERPAANLVFLLDVSGSMSSEDKLPLLQRCLRELAPKLREDDRITMVVYASKAGEVLEPTPGNDRKTILEAVNALTAKGSTNGESGIRIAYQRARENFIEDGVNRILLATDGDFNVGQDSDDELVSLIEKEAKSGIELTVLGFGTGNLNDSMLEKITNKGNGQFHYIDRLEEGRRVLVEGMNGSLVTIAKDVKIQVEFNAGKVARYRLIGYANRKLAREDFNDDRKDAGEIGAGHSVTALYEIVPVEAAMKLTQAEPIDELKYKKLAGEKSAEAETPFGIRRQAAREQQGIELVESPELLTVKLKYKRPNADKSEPELQFSLVDPGNEFADASADFRFATAVGAFGEWLRVSPASANWISGGKVELNGNRQAVLIQQGRSNRPLEKIGQIALGAIEGDEFGRKQEFVEMIQAAAKLNGGSITLEDAGENSVAREIDDLDVGESVKEKLRQLR